jgi:hypothetical protein
MKYEDFTIIHSTMSYSTSEVNSMWEEARKFKTAYISEDIMKLAKC